MDDVPVIDSLGAWVRAAEAAVDERREGKTPAGTGYFDALPDPVRRDEIVEFYGLSRV
ncbi:MAG: hypothetical protein JSS15_07940 [Proteobacteria bacterium]|nr:hypothetical protein [Pseudomonadota bacterium]